MKDTFYSTKRYIGKYIPIYTFEAYGDTVNYFIKLQYICNRDDYQNIRTTKGARLDFDMKNEDGDAIFGDIASGHLELLKSRKYTLEAESIPEEVPDDDRLVEINEIYVYEPSDEFIKYDSEIVPIWGIEDDTESATTSIVFGTSNDWSNKFVRTEAVFTSTENFKTGDVVSVTCTANYWFTTEQSGVEVSHTASCTMLVNSTISIRAISGNLVEFDTTLTRGEIPTGLIEAGDAFGDQTVNTVGVGLSDSAFFRWFEGLDPIDGYVYATSCVVDKEYSSRAYLKRLSLIRERNLYSKEIPEIPTRFAPSNQVGTEYTIIGASTTTSPIEWKTKVANGDWFIYTEPELRFDSTLGLYHLRIKETKCV